MWNFQGCNGVGGPAPDVGLLCMTPSQFIGLVHFVLHLPLVDMPHAGCRACAASGHHALTCERCQRSTVTRHGRHDTHDGTARSAVGARCKMRELSRLLTHPPWYMLASPRPD